MKIKTGSKAFLANGSYLAFCNGVGIRRSIRCPQHSHRLGRKDGIESLRELGIPVMDERFRFDWERVELPEQVAHLLCHPSPCWMCRRLSEQDASGTEFNENDHVEGGQSERLDGMSRNGYSYVEGNPVNHADPSGEFLLLGGIIGGIVGFVGGHFGAEVIGGWMYDQMQEGKCGCDKQVLTQNVSREAFIGEMQEPARILGGILGAMAGSGGILAVLGGAIGVGMSGAGIIDSLALTGLVTEDGSPNVCSFANLALSIMGLAGSALAIRYGYATGALSELRNPSLILSDAMLQVRNFPTLLSGLRSGTAQQVVLEILRKSVSPNTADQLEASVALQLMDEGYKIVNLNRGFGPNNSIGEIDIELADAIIEVTEVQSGKLSQITRLLHDPTINPNGKPVILYAPNYGGRGLVSSYAIQDIEVAGARVVPSMHELLIELRSLP